MANSSQPGRLSFLFDLDGTLIDSVRPLPRAPELLASLTEHHVPWAIATSGAERYARLALELLELPADTPLITRDQVRYAKPDPDLFLTAAAKVGVDIADSFVVGYEDPLDLPAHLDEVGVRRPVQS
jgi:beta-phosphoglucomutase-like phosphatase (HAD superfamily)